MGAIVFIMALFAMMGFSPIFIIAYEKLIKRNPQSITEILKEY